MADTIRPIGRVANRLPGLSCRGGSREDGLRVIRSAGAIRDGALKLAARASVREIETLRVLPLRPEQVGRKDNERMRRASKPRRLRDRIGDQLLDRDFVIRELMDERGVGPVF